MTPLDYFPGHKPSSPAFRALPADSVNPRDQILQFDTNYGFDIASKMEALKESTSRYYQKIEPVAGTEVVLSFLYDLAKQSKYFGTFGTGLPTDSWDFVARNIQEDIVVYDVKDQRTILIHLCHANGWTAEGWIGKDFEWIHKDVKNSKGDLIVPNPNKFVDRIMKIKGSIERVGAISFNAVCNLNRHPSREKQPRSFDPANPSLFMRVERQTVTPFPTQGLFLFTIKTYFYDCSDPKYIDAAIDIFENPHPDLYSKEFVDNRAKDVLPWLKSVREKI